MGRFGAAAPVGVGEDIVNMVAFGVRLGTGGAGDMERGVDAGTGVLGGIGVFVGSAIGGGAVGPGVNLGMCTSC